MKKPKLERYPHWHCHYTTKPNKKRKKKSETTAFWVSPMKSLRTSTVILGFSNILVIVAGVALVGLLLPPCNPRSITFPIAGVSFGAALKIFAMVQSAMAQKAAAISVLDPSAHVNRLERRYRYKKWLSWSRFSMVITTMQIMAAVYLVVGGANYISNDGTSNQCHSVVGFDSNNNTWREKILILYLVMVCSVPPAQCLMGSDVLRWRSFYSTQDDAWRAHYQEVFDHGIRQALCCLGRVKYLSVSSEDEVYLVARLLGDLVAYRASGTGHLELLAGLALLQWHSESPQPDEGLVEAPKELMQEALDFHKFAEAAYTGPLLDFGRHAVLFPCAWLFRQGILTPWARNSRPILAGDNWWRGHAAAFLKYVNLPPSALRKGRVCQQKCEAAYFILVLDHLRSVVIAVRGTETPEDLITDGLGRECPLSREDLEGLINGNHIHPDVKQRVESSFPHYGHSGIVEAARDLYTQIEGNHRVTAESRGSLSSLLGAGCECYGYNLRIVGHSLGGAIAALLGIRLYHQYPNLHVYAYGPLPCVDLVIAEACSGFVTSIIHDNEFSARLSVGALLRLRASAIMALAQDSKTDSALIFRLARRFLNASNYQQGRIEAEDASDLRSGAAKVEEPNQAYVGGNNLDHPAWDESDTIVGDIDATGNCQNSIYNPAGVANPLNDPVSQFLESVSNSESGSAGEQQEVFLPGLLVHMVPEQRTNCLPLWKAWRLFESVQSYKAYLANREFFKDIVVSPSMFLDHLPWRCHSAMRKVLEAHNVKDLLDASQIV